MRPFEHWVLKLGEAHVVDEETGIDYIVVAGYVNHMPKSLYVRIYDHAGVFYGGTWIDYKTFTLPARIVEKCIELARRMEKLVVFA